MKNDYDLNGQTALSSAKTQNGLHNSLNYKIGANQSLFGTFDFSTGKPNFNLPGEVCRACKDALTFKNRHAPGVDFCKKCVGRWAIEIGDRTHFAAITQAVEKYRRENGLPSRIKQSESPALLG